MEASKVLAPEVRKAQADWVVETASFSTKRRRSRGKFFTILSRDPRKINLLSTLSACVV